MFFALFHINKFICFDSSVLDIIRLNMANHVKLLFLFRFVLQFESHKPLFAQAYYLCRRNRGKPRTNMLQQLNAMYLEYRLITDGCFNS